MANQSEVAAHLDVSRQTVAKLCATGVLTKAPGRSDYDLDECRFAYIRNLREQAAGRAGAGGSKLNLADERARQAYEQANAIALKNAEQRKELLPRTVVLDAVQSANSRVRSKLLAMPSRIAPLVSGLKSTSAVEAKLTEVIYEALSELASTAIEEPEDAEDTSSPDARELDGPEPPDGGGDAGVVQRVRAPAKANRKSVGRRKPGAKPRGQRGAG